MLCSHIFHMFHIPYSLLLRTPNCSHRPSKVVDSLWKVLKAWSLADVSSLPITPISPITPIPSLSANLGTTTLVRSVAMAVSEPRLIQNAGNNFVGKLVEELSLSLVGIRAPFACPADSNAISLTPLAGSNTISLTPLCITSAVQSIVPATIPPTDGALCMRNTAIAIPIAVPDTCSLPGVSGMCESVPTTQNPYVASMITSPNQASSYQSNFSAFFSRPCLSKSMDLDSFFNDV